MTTTYPASEKQRNFIKVLIAERVEAFPEAIDTIRAELNKAHRDGDLTSDLASDTISTLKELKVPQAQPEIGVYVLTDGTIVKAQPNKSKTNVYTMRWVEIGGERLVDATEERVHGEWEYDPSLKGQLATARKMTLQEAKDFILRYGKCVRCSRKLKAAQSVEQGIGPVCITYFGAMA